MCKKTGACTLLALRVVHYEKSFKLERYGGNRDITEEVLTDAVQTCG